ncbi:MAG: pyrroloquinoline quinone biosynthesis peptide chaperone PqqD [Trebonia sp.]
MNKPRLAPHVRLAFDRSRGKQVLLAPESVITLNDTGASVVRLCDGTRTPEEIIAVLRDQYDDVDAKEVQAFLARLASLRCLRPGSSETGSSEAGPSEMGSAEMGEPA